MCVIFYKPAAVQIAPDLLTAALALNHDGWGLMGFAADGSLLIERHGHTDEEAVRAAVARHKDAELVLHLRQRTRGAVGEHNAHPFKVAEGLYLMHNGTLPFASRSAAHSDTWHFVNDVLRPLHARFPGLSSDEQFLGLLELAIKPDNKIALLDERARRIVLLNAAHGAELDGLWLSNTRWIDRRLLPLTDTPQPQQRSYAADKLHFS